VVACKGLCDKSATVCQIIALCYELLTGRIVAANETGQLAASPRRRCARTGTQGAAMRKHVRKIVSTILIGAMFFFAPSMIPINSVGAQVRPSCGTVPVSWLPTDTAFAGAAPRVIPCPPGHTHTPVWPWVVIGCAGSIVLSALAADFWNNRQLTTAEAWTCGLLYWIPMPNQPQPAKAAVRTKG
jgi:hypothetical protein